MTFGNVNVEFKVIDVEAPEEAGDEVKYVSGEVTPEPLSGGNVVKVPTDSPAKGDSGRFGCKTLSRRRTE